ncbi:MAG TPA: hypothetical protein VK982_10355, partial [Bacteroidales bacterium]|nr:hypothetical protein [Bacteroidales bacterium]
ASLQTEYKFDEVSKSEVLEGELINSINDVTEVLKIKLKGGYCSNLLKRQIANHRKGNYEKFGSKLQNYHGSTILDTIEAVEDGHKTNIRPFNNRPLKGLFHVHHNSNTFLSINIQNYWQTLIKGKNEIEYQNKRLKEIFLNLENTHSTKIAEEKSVLVLLNKIKAEASFREFSVKTGEWIVFAQIDNKNYYLCLATHGEAIEFGDEIIFNRISDCFQEFPNVEELLSKQ